MGIAHRLLDYENPRSLGSRLRRRRSEPIKQIIRTVYGEKGSCRIIDVGGTETYWNVIGDAFLTEHSASIVLLNINPVPVRNPATFRSEVGDACDLKCFRDDEFDLAFSNSVIEHVGDWPRMERFASELARIGRRYYVQTPNFWFPIDPHRAAPFVHWLPEPVQASFQLRVTLGYRPRCQNVGDAMRSVQRARLLDRKAFAFLFPDATIQSERFAFLTKSLIAIRG